MSLPGILLKKIRAHPLSRNLNIDSPEAVAIHRRIIRENALLYRHYVYIYQYFKRTEDSLAALPLASLEIGSGGGFLKDFLPSVITSDVVKSVGIDCVQDATRLSFSDNSLKAIYANGVLHHLRDPEACLNEIQRVLVPQGIFVCNEPSSIFFGYFMNKYFHNEYTNRSVKEWIIQGADSQGRLTQANMALPYIIFKRDSGLFRQRFKSLKVISFVYHDFLRYALSGGLSYIPLIPRYLYGTIDFIEWFLRPLMPILGNNMLVTIKKTDSQ